MSLQIRDLTQNWGQKRALDGVGFTLEAGEFCALLGPNGAGKSTLFGLLTRLFTPKQGHISIAGHDLSRAPDKALASLGVVFQQPTLDLDLTVWRNLLYFAGLHGIKGAAARTAARRALEQLGMGERADEKARDLNGGHRRRLEIARALLHRPRVLLLDEPTVGLDAATRHALVSHVHALARERGITVLWATHLTDEVAAEDRLIVLHQGRILRDGPAGMTGAQLSDAFLALTRKAVP
ncbi:putative ABC transporter ATP-binding protein YbhF [Aquimixticola soesokkakensis]|uniref:Putative ABC transporter ATP-binding protein YbhF n=1 Tax=Aquimixticola soesokkakensis TaxID=1519096 RepID=A0A1Y5RTR0_9RHOB|nr:ABC transporter ATP-binding protein [Aquimixticola soesokkakensis]SLN25352.1 putative ABC transporter ATP-binding protein YbhF [Aquimixticola soesokkakensis]